MENKYFHFTTSHRNYQEKCQTDINIFFSSNTFHSREVIGKQILFVSSFFTLLRFTSYSAIREPTLICNTVGSRKR